MPWPIVIRIAAKLLAKKLSKKNVKQTVKNVTKNAAKKASRLLPKKKSKSVTKCSKPKLKKKLSKRDEYLGRTPGKWSKTGKDVQKRMEKEGNLRYDENKKPEIKYTDPKTGKETWHKLDEKVDMAHKKDAVKWWNETGKNYGPKSSEVRKWMRDPDNYVLQPRSVNRSEGAKIGETYGPPARGL